MTATEAHPVARAPRWSGLGRPVAAAAGMAGVVLMLRWRDPHRAGSYGLCPFAWLTGLACPGCGGMRAVNDLASGQVLAAVSSNALLVAAVPVVVALWSRWAVAGWRGSPPRQPFGSVRRHVLATRALMLLLVVFAVVRNLPAGSWLAP